MTLPRRLLAILGALLLLVAVAPPTSAAERDKLAVLDMDAPAYAAYPATLLPENNTEDIARIVFEARDFGVPLAVRVISTPDSVDGLSANPAVGGTLPSQQEITQRLADEWLADEETIESSAGAADGILLLVVVPDDGQTHASAAFATGPNALPQNGLTRSGLDRIVTDVMQPAFAKNQVGQGVANGVATVSYKNLFVTSPRVPLSPGTQHLNKAADLPLAGLTLAGALALLGLVLWQRRRRPGMVPEEPLSPFAAGALARGRVDDAVATTAVLDLVARGALVPHTATSPLGGMTLELGPEPEHLDAFVCRVWDALRTQADGSGRLSPAATRRLPEVLAPARHWLEDDLASRGLFNPRARVEIFWLVLACGGALALAGYTLAPAIVGLARWGVLAIIVVVAAVVIAAWWAARRSWATMAGHVAQHDWEARHRAEGSPAIAIYDAIVYQDMLLKANDLPATSPGVSAAVRSLRGLGAG